MLYSVITTIQSPTSSVLQLVDKLQTAGGKLIVAGDKKGPGNYDDPRGERQPEGAESNWPVEFLSLEMQLAMPFELGGLLPVGHYARKNIAYLSAIQQGATCIYETDDDNAPNEHWGVRQCEITGSRLVPETSHCWVNVYRFFSDENIWPRGLPLDEIHSVSPETEWSIGAKSSPIQQGLVNGSADVDAIWRLVMDREFFFQRAESVYLKPGNWCPFNTQSTWWWPVAYPLLYIPSYCSFRMCDIWKSFVAQRCLWELGMGVAFHAPEVYQDRNAHDLMRDFRDEVPGYKQNRDICRILSNLELRSGVENVTNNFVCCYTNLVAQGVFPAKEMELVRAWVNGLEAINSVHIC